MAKIKESAIREKAIKILLFNDSMGFEDLKTHELIVELLEIFKSGCKGYDQFSDKALLKHMKESYGYDEEEYSDYAGRDKEVTKTIEEFEAHIAVEKMLR